ARRRCGENALGAAANPRSAHRQKRPRRNGAGQQRHQRRRRRSKRVLRPRCGTPILRNATRSAGCLKIGSHVSFSGKGLLAAAEEALGYGATTFMIYTGAPQNTRRKPMEEQYVPEGLAVLKEYGINEIVAHAPYIINLGSYKTDSFGLA